MFPISIIINIILLSSASFHCSNIIETWFVKLILLAIDSYEFVVKYIKLVVMKIICVGRAFTKVIRFLWKHKGMP